MEKATDIVVEMVKSLRKENLSGIQQFNAELHSVESEADDKMIELYRELFNSQREVLEIIALKDLYEQLEKVIDRCRDAGSTIGHIGLKNA